MGWSAFLCERGSAFRLSEVRRDVPDWAGAVILQIPLVAAVAYGFLSRKLRASGEVDDLQARHIREIDYLEARRAEERDGRIAAERRVSELTERWDRALDLLAGIEKELIRGAGRGHGDAP